MRRPNAHEVEVLGDTIEAAGFEVGVARSRGGFILVARHDASRPVRLGQRNFGSIAAAREALDWLMLGVRLSAGCRR